MSSRAFPLLVVLLGVAASAVHAQSTMTVSAQVGPAITISGARPLQFGSVTPGMAVTVPVSSVNSGRFILNGIGSAGVRLVFTLPTTLSRGGTATMPVDNWTACRNNNNNSVNGCTAFTPTGGAGTTATFHPSGQMNVFVGGRVTPAANQPAGAYTGTVVLTVSYI